MCGCNTELEIPFATTGPGSPEAALNDTWLWMGLCHPLGPADQRQPEEPPQLQGEGAPRNSMSHPTAAKQSPNLPHTKVMLVTRTSSSQGRDCQHGKSHPWWFKGRVSPKQNPSPRQELRMALQSRSRNLRDSRAARRSHQQRGQRRESRIAHGSAAALPSRVLCSCSDAQWHRKCVLIIQ